VGSQDEGRPRGSLAGFAMSGADVAKCLALGADAIRDSATPALMALTCNKRDPRRCDGPTRGHGRRGGGAVATHCHKGRWPSGSTTGKGSGARKRLDVDERGFRAVSTSCTALDARGGRIASSGPGGGRGPACHASNPRPRRGFTFRRASGHGPGSPWRAPDSSPAPQVRKTGARRRSEPTPQRWRDPRREARSSPSTGRQGR